MAELALSEMHDGGRFDLRVGDAVLVTLAEGAGGYRWDIASLDEAYLAVESQQYGAGRRDAGSAGSAEWRLRAKQQGHTVLELKKARPWEPAGTAIERFKVSFDLR